MYEKFYNLKAEPFRLSPDHHFCYEHKGYAKARAYMGYAFMRAEGFVMITGRPGTGKTTLIGELIESLSDANVTTAHLVCTQLEADDLLKIAAYSFGVDHRIVEKGELLQQLDIMLRRWHRDERRALLIVDEAQDLSESAMEELRLLTNIQEGGIPLLQIFLLGQPELRDLVLSPSLEQVHQRIIAASHLESLEREETEAYIIHRLEKVGWRGDPALSRSIFPLIYKFSEGVPRRINLICSRMFLNGCVEQRHEIGVADVREVIKELQFEKLAVGKEFSDDEFELEDDFDYYVPKDDAPSDTAVDEAASAEVDTAPYPEAQVSAEEAELELEEEILEELEEELLEELEHDIDEELEEYQSVVDETENSHAHSTSREPVNNSEPLRSDPQADDAMAEQPATAEASFVGHSVVDVAPTPPPVNVVQAQAKQAQAEQAAALADAPMPGQPWLGAVSDGDAASAQQQTNADINNLPTTAAAPQSLASDRVDQPASAKPSGNATFVILGLALVFALLVGGLVHDLGLDPMKDWPSQLGQWWQSVVDGVVEKLSPAADVATAADGQSVSEPLAGAESTPSDLESAEEGQAPTEPLSALE